MKLIDAEQLRTELKMLRRRYGYNELWDLSCYQAELGLARVGLIDEILSLLNTLEETSDNWKPSEEQPEVDLEKFTEKMDAWKARYSRPDDIPIKATMAFTARMFYMYPNVAREWYDSLPKATQD